MPWMATYTNKSVSTLTKQHAIVLNINHFQTSPQGKGIMTFKDRLTSFFAKKTYQATNALIFKRVARKHLKHISGLENLPKNGPYIIIANHSSFMDHYALATLFKHSFSEKLFFLTKKESFDKFISRVWHHAMGAIPLDRNKPEKQTLKTIVNLINDKKIIVIYPEGTRGPGDKLLPFKSGAFKIAMRMKVPIIPVGIKGANQVMPIGSFWPKQGQISISIGKPINQSLINDKRLDDVIAQSHESIETLAFSSSPTTDKQAQSSNSAMQLVKRAEQLVEDALNGGSSQIKTSKLNCINDILTIVSSIAPVLIEGRILHARIIGLKAIKRTFPFNLHLLLQALNKAKSVLLDQPSHPMANYIVGRFHQQFSWITPNNSTLNHLETAYSEAPNYGITRESFSLPYAKALIKSGEHSKATDILNHLLDVYENKYDERSSNRVKKAGRLLQKLADSGCIHTHVQ